MYNFVRQRHIIQLILIVLDLNLFLFIHLFIHCCLLRS